METKAATGEEILGWKKSCLWLALAVACFHAAYTSLKYPALGLFIFGYAFALVKLTAQPTVRRAFYFGLAAGFLCYAPQLFFLWRIFSACAVVLWLVLAFWAGLFAAIVCGSARRWGQARAAWLIPVVWTGIEYFRSELYFLKFPWLNVGYAYPNYPLVPLLKFGTYGAAFFVFATVSVFIFRKQTKQKHLEWLVVSLFILVVIAFFSGLANAIKFIFPKPALAITGVQMEFPPEKIIPEILTQALAKNTNAQIFVLSEYTLDGPPPDALKNWCHEHSRFLVVGGKGPAGTNHFYNTAFVIGTNGDVVFKQVKSVPIQFFADGLPAPEQKIWESPWGKIGLCICYDLGYTRVTDVLIRQGAQLIICPTMDVEWWGRHEHELHARVAPVRAAEYGVPIFRVDSSGISQAVAGGGYVVAQTSIPGNGEIFSAQLRLPRQGSLPLDRWFAPFCTGLTGIVTAWLLVSNWRGRRGKNPKQN